VTLTLPDATKNARIVFQSLGPVRRLALRHVPSDWHLVSAGIGPDLAGSIEELRRLARRQGYAVAPGDATEDLRGKKSGGTDDD
jgi:hypothetical protein